MGSKTWRDFYAADKSGKPKLDGRAMLEHAVTSGEWRSVEDALAALTVFAHPDAIGALCRKAPFRVIRATKALLRGNFHTTPDGQIVMVDDNTSAHAAVRLGSGFGCWNDITVNHLYASSREPEHYTNPMNIVLTPTFLAKLTDSQAKDQTPGKLRFLDILRFRAFNLYEYSGPEPNAPPPIQPSNYPAQSRWALPVGEGLTSSAVAERIERMLKKSPKARHTRSIANLRRCASPPADG